MELKTASLYCLRCSGNSEVYKKCLLYWKYGDGRVKKGEITFYNLDGEEIEKQSRVIEWDAEAAEKAGYEHFMMKEIHEQPKAVEDTLNSVLQDGSLNLEEMGFTEEIINNISCIYIVACGSAWHVGMTAQYVIEDMAGIPVRVEVASEFRYRNLSLIKTAW